MLFNSGIHKAIEENKKLGIPSVFDVNGTMVYQLPNGDVVMKLPKKYKKMYDSVKL